MNKEMFGSFKDELTKIASKADLATHAVELAGLGTLAAPHIYSAVTGKRAKHKTERAAELGGLGTLAAPSIKSLATHALTRK